MNTTAATINAEVHRFVRNLPKVCDLSEHHALHQVQGRPVIVSRRHGTTVALPAQFRHLAAGAAVIRLWRPVLVAWLAEHPVAEAWSRQAAEAALAAWEGI